MNHRLRSGSNRRYRGLGVLVVAILLVVPATVAFATWTATSTTSSGGAIAGSLAPLAAPVVSVSGRNVTVTWAAPPTGPTPDSYTVRRYGGPAGPVTPGAGCNVSAIAATCVEQNVPGGTWTYTVTAHLHDWFSESPRSAAVPVSTVSCSIAPNQVILPSGGTIRGGVLSGFGRGEAVTFHLVDALGPTIAAADDDDREDRTGRTFTLRLRRGMGLIGTNTLVAVGTSGASAICGTFLVVVDTSPPVVSLTTSPSTPDGNNGWFRTAPVVVTITATDSPAGVADIRYALVGAQFLNAKTIVADSVQIPITATGRTTITYSATDRAGNGAPFADAVIALDTKVPTAALSFVPPATSDGWVGPTAVPTIKATDAGSGIASVSYGVNGGPSSTIVSVTGAPAAASVAVGSLPSGTSSIAAASTDIAGNSSAPTAIVTVDSVAPTATIKPVVAATVAGTVPLSADARDATPGSGVASVQFEWSAASGPENWQAIGASLPPAADGRYSAPFDTTTVPNGGYKLRITVKDRVGNTTRSVLGGATTPQTITVANLRASGLSLLNGTGPGAGAPGRVDAGDKIVLTFDGPLKIETICPALGSTPTLAGAPAGIIVTLSDGGEKANDWLAVSAAACGPTGLKLGTITLGSRNYYGKGSGEDNGGGDKATPATFGTATAASSMVWDQPSKTLTITLGGLTTTGRFQALTPPVALVATFIPDSTITAIDSTSILVVPVRTSGVAAIF